MYTTITITNMNEKTPTANNLLSILLTIFLYPLFDNFYISLVLLYTIGIRVCFYIFSLYLKKSFDRSQVIQSNVSFILLYNKINLCS